MVDQKVVCEVRELKNKKGFKQVSVVIVCHYNVSHKAQDKNMLPHVMEVGLPCDAVPVQRFRWIIEREIVGRVAVRDQRVNLCEGQTD